MGIAQRYAYSIELLPLEACVNVVVDLRGGRCARLPPPWPVPVQPCFVLGDLGQVSIAVRSCLNNDNTKELPGGSGAFVGAPTNQSMRGVGVKIR